MSGIPIPSRAMGGKFEVFYGDPGIGSPVLGVPIRPPVTEALSAIIAQAQLDQGKRDRSVS